MEDLYLVLDYQLQIKASDFLRGFYTTNSRLYCLYEIFKVVIILRWNIYQFFKINLCPWYCARQKGNYFCPQGLKNFTKHRR